MAAIDLKKCVLKIKDAGSNFVTVTFGEGNLNYNERKNIEYVRDRGVLDDVKEGDEEPMEVNFNGLWEYITGSGSGGTPTIEDALKGVGAAAAWVSTDSDACRPYAVDLELTYTPTPSTCGDIEVITFPDFRYEQLQHDLRNNSISVQGRCNATKAVAARTAQS